jgi:hypothetical protein
MKYIIFDNCFPVIFSEGISHNEVTVHGMKPTSAGFAILIGYGNYITVNCYGESVSLKLSHKEHDEEIITKSVNQ